MSKNVKNAAGKSDKYDALLLDNQLCFPFYVCAKEIVNRYTPFLNNFRKACYNDIRSGGHLRAKTR